MNNIVKAEKQLPGALPELSKFVLVGREKLTAVRAEIRAIEKVGLAKEVHEQKLREAQAIAEAVLDAEVRIGELTAAMPKEKNQHTAVDSGVHSTKKQALEEIGLTERQANRFETLAKHLDIVEEEKAKARKNEDIVSRSNVLRTITEKNISKRVDPVKQATREHEAFRQTRQSDVIDLRKTSTDKANRKILAEDLYAQCLRTGKDIFTLYDRLWAEEINAEELVPLLTDDQIKSVQGHFQEVIRQISNISMRFIKK